MENHCIQVYVLCDIKYIFRWYSRIGVFMCKHKHWQQITYVFIFIEKKERACERERERQQQENWISSIKSKVLRCAYLICFRDWTLAKLVRLPCTSSFSSKYGMARCTLYNNVIFSLYFTYLFVENRLEFISNFERPWKLNLLYLLRIEPTNSSIHPASQPVKHASPCAHTRTTPKPNYFCIACIKWYLTQSMI